MQTISPSPTLRPAHDRLRSWRLAMLIGLLLGMVPGIAGCGGCFGEDPIEARRRREEEAKKKEAEKPKDDVDFDRVRSLPRDESSTLNFAKSGHWIAAWQLARANNFDVSGELVSATTAGAGRASPVPGTPFRLRTVRPAPLPRGQAKLFESQFFVPAQVPNPENDGVGKALWMESSLRYRRGGRELKRTREIITRMPDYQYYLIVLSDDPDRYGYLGRMQSVSPPCQTAGDSISGDIMHYRIAFPRKEGRLPLPSAPLAWTSIAYIVWDGMNPNRLSLAQQQALLDWVHWGGQIVVSGPNSLGLLRNSFLDAYLPALGEDAVELVPADLEALNDRWSLFSERESTAPRLFSSPERPLVGVRLVPHPSAVALPDTDGLVLERTVGRGRIVVSAFSLTDRSVVNWPSYDSFLNACLLRRPRRKFTDLPRAGGPQTAWADLPASVNIEDGRITTRSRYFTRDVGFGPPQPGNRRDLTSVSNVAGWHDDGASAEAARRTLSQAAGIQVPDASFVFRTLAIYLVVLVPANWLVFRLLGRVEWAWLAAPLIALVGAGVVIRLAQLDIGFARSRTEVGILELQGGYPRAHLTRYMALYASLSTAFDLSFDDPSALALPFPEALPYRVDSSLSDLELRRGRTCELSGFLVKSSAAGYIHSEQFVPLDGAIDVVSDADGRWTLQNASQLALRDVGVLLGGDEGQVLRAWLGDVRPETSVPLRFEKADRGSPCFAEWRQSPECCSSHRMQIQLFAERDTDGDDLLSEDEWGAAQPLGDFSAIAESESGITREDLERAIETSRAGTLSLGRHLDLACDNWPLHPGDMRLIGWTDQAVPGVSVSPSPAQNVAQTLVVVHLKYGALPLARPDVNLLSDVDAGTERFAPPFTPEP
jgi:hypothetical protein